MKEENQAIIKALNMYGRVPEQWELLNEIERLNNRVSELEKAVSRKEEQITDLDDENFDLENEIEILHSIIKEVREWTKKYSCQFTNDDGELVVSEISFNIQARPCDLFKILDKGNNNE